MAEHIDAERAAFEAWHRSKFATKYSTGQPTRDMHNGVYAEKYGPENQQLMWEAWQAARRTPSASIGEDGLPGLPELPRPAVTYADHSYPAYSKKQMADFATAYARDAVAADRRAREAGHTAEMAKWARDNGLNVPPQWAAAPPLSSEQIRDKDIIEAMRPHMFEADGGYACDLAAEHVVAGVRAVLRLSAGQKIEKGEGA